MIVAELVAYHIEATQKNVGVAYAGEKQAVEVASARVKVRDDIAEHNAQAVVVLGFDDHIVVAVLPFAGHDNVRAV